MYMPRIIRAEPANADQPGRENAGSVCPSLRLWRHRFGCVEGRKEVTVNGQRRSRQNVGSDFGDREPETREPVACQCRQLQVGR
jgi:hypothetical protein